MRPLSRLVRLAFGALVAVAPLTAAAADPLPSWNAGPAKEAIVAFVDAVTTPGSADYVDPSARIAVFDNDGTLWAEQPLYFQVAFTADEIRRLAPEHPDWASAEPFRSIIAGDTAAALAGGDKAIDAMMAATHAGMTTDDFHGRVARWIATAEHPTRHVPYRDLVYQPQLELLAYLRAEGFKTFIVSGGGADFMRVFSEELYAIPTEQVVGTVGIAAYSVAADGTPVLTKEAGVDFIDDGPGKPVGIWRNIGRRPLLAFGNSDGDREMLEWTAAGDGRRLALVLHHTDAAREWAYDRHSAIGRLDKALDEAVRDGWLVVDMARDWRTVFPERVP